MTLEQSKVIAEIAEFLCLDEVTVRNSVRNSRSILEEEWSRASPQSIEDEARFYRSTLGYILEGAQNLESPFGFLYLRFLASKAIGTVLDFGGGIGTLSLWAFKRGATSVTYVDAGKTAEFARWRFARRRSQGIQTVASLDEVSGSFDTIYCIDVLEHLADPAKLLGVLAAKLSRRGRIWIHAPFGWCKEVPMHHDSAVPLRTMVESCGLRTRWDPFGALSPNYISARADHAP